MITVSFSPMKEGVAKGLTLLLLVSFDVS